MRDKYKPLARDESICEQRANRLKRTGAFEGLEFSEKRSQRLQRTQHYREWSNSLHRAFDPLGKSLLLLRNMLTHSGTSSGTGAEPARNPPQGPFQNSKPEDPIASQL